MRSAARRDTRAGHKKRKLQTKAGLSLAAVHEVIEHLQNLDVARLSAFHDKRFGHVELYCRTNSYTS